MLYNLIHYSSGAYFSNLMYLKMFVPINITLLYLSEIFSTIFFYAKYMYILLIKNYV